jgi:hypothetical protein
VKSIEIKSLQAKTFVEKEISNYSSINENIVLVHQIYVKEFTKIANES